MRVVVLGGTMTMQFTSLQESPPIWVQWVTRGVPFDPASVFVYLLLVGLVYILWRNLSR